MNYEVTVVMIDGRGNDPHAIPALKAVSQRLSEVGGFSGFPILLTPPAEKHFDMKLLPFIAPLDTLSGPLTYEQYNELVFNGLLPHLRDFIGPTGNEKEASSHILLCQSDGFPVNPHRWNPAWLHFDYIGAPWPRHLIAAKYRDACPVGNGGFSLRSRRLLDACKALPWPSDPVEWPSPPEDVVICQHYRKTLEEQGIRFAPPEVAAAFSLENETEWSIPIEKTFGFHSFTHNRTRDAMLWRLMTSNEGKRP